VTHALEDLPEPARAQVTAIIGAVPRPLLWKRIFDLQPPGSVRATPQELATLIAAVARAEQGQPE
jgi:hypothetical protein